MLDVYPYREKNQELQYVIKFVSYEAFQTNLKELSRKFGRIKRILLIHSQREEFRAGRIWVIYAGGLKQAASTV